MQLAVRRVAQALFSGQAQELADGQQVEVAANHPRRALAFIFVDQRCRRLHLVLEVAVVEGGGIKLRVDGHQLPTVIERQVADQHGGLGLELTADQVALGHRQLQALGVFDLVTAEGDDLAPDAAENMPIGNKVGFPGKGLGAARVEVDQAFLQQGELVLIVAGLGFFVEVLQQDQVGLLIANHPRHFIQAEGHVFTGRAVIRAAAVDQVVPEHIALAGQVLDVPGHDLDRLPGHQRGGGDRATDCQHLFSVRAPRNAVNQASHNRGAQH